MKNFESKWQTLVARARQSPPGDEPAPFGFAARIAARARAEAAPAFDDIWRGLAVRLLAGVAAALLVCAVMELPHLSRRPALETGIENTVAKLVWSL